MPPNGIILFRKRIETPQINGISPPGMKYNEVNIQAYSIMLQGISL